METRVTIAFVKITTHSNNHSQHFEERSMGGVGTNLVLSSQNLDQGISFGLTWKFEISK